MMNNHYLLGFLPKETSISFFYHGLLIKDNSMEIVIDKARIYLINR